MGTEEQPSPDDDLEAYVIIDDGSEEPRTLASVIADAPDVDGKQRHLHFVRGGKTRQTDRLVETYGDDRVLIMVVADELTAIGYFINLLELHQFDEDSVYEQLAESETISFADYVQWRDGLTTRDRKIRLLDQAEADSEDFDFYDTVLETGSWRSITHSAATETLATTLHSEFEFNPKGCYRNARHVLSTETYWQHDDLQYVEGIGLSKHAARITGHAWLELDEEVIELTWPWHTPLPPGEAVYFGTIVPRQQLQDAWTRGEGGPYLLNVPEDVPLGR